MKFLVLGGGAQGSAAAFDLCRRDRVTSVKLADLCTEKVRPFLGPHLGEKLEMLAVDADDGGQVRAAIEGMDAVLCALPYYYNTQVTEAAIEAGVHYCDLGGNTQIVFEQKELDGAARDAGVSVVPDCGLAPGLVNVLARAAIDALDEAHTVEIRAGGLPQDPKPPLNYQVVYSLEGMLDYCVQPALVLETGSLTEVEPLSALELIDFPGVGSLEAFHTAGGISTLPHKYAGRVGEMNYKTLRYPGHARILRAIRDLGLVSEEPIEVDGCMVIPKHAFIAAVTPVLRNPEGNDLVAVRVEAHGTRDGAPASVRFDLLDRYDPETGITAMVRTTGFSLAITALMQADGRIGDPGVHTPDECVPAGAYLEELAWSGVKVRRVS